MVKGICKNCGKEYEYEPKKGSYKLAYCSVECKTEFNKKEISNYEEDRLSSRFAALYDTIKQMKKNG